MSQFRREPRHSTATLIVMAALFIFLTHQYFADEAANRVDRSPYHSEDVADSATQGILVGSPDEISDSFIFRGRTINVCRVWLEHSYSYRRIGVYETERFVDPDLYLQIAFRGTEMMQEHMRTPFRFTIDDQPAKLMLTNEGSFLRARTKGFRSRAIMRVFEGPTSVLEYEVDTTDKQPNQALQTTPVTRSVYEKTIEFGDHPRGV